MRNGFPAFFVTALTLALAPAAQAEDHTLDLVSVGPQQGPSQPYNSSYEGSSDDGSRVFFSTNEALVSADQDTQYDVYMRAGGTVTLIAPGPSQTDFQAASEDGSRVVFGTDDS